MAEPLRPNRIRGLVRIVHPFPSLLVAAVTVAIVPMADRSTPAWIYVTLGLGMLCYQFAIGVANDLVDRADDAELKPEKPLPRGDLTPAFARRLAVVLAVAGMAITFPLDIAPWLVGVAGLGCGLLYDAWLKRTLLSWAPLALALPLVPVWVFLSADAWDALLWWAFPLGLLLGVSLHLANQLPDLPGEGGGRVRGMTHRLQARRALALAMAAFGAAASMACLVLAFVSSERAVLAAIAAAVAMLTGSRATRIFGRNGLFGVLAVSSAILAVVFLSAA